MSKPDTLLLNYASQIEGIESFQQEWNGIDPFAIATIVRAEGPTAANPGSKALITMGGEIIGFTGGGCLRSAILKASKDAIRQQKPQFIRSQPKDTIDETQSEEGMTIYPSSCPSRGEVDVFIEPVSPKVPVIIHGETETAHVLIKLCEVMGYEVAPSGRMASNDPAGDANGQDVTEVSSEFTVIATQGRGDKAALLKAMDSVCPHIFFVASNKKADHWREQLRAAGYTDADLARLISPAGIDFGARYPKEIALSIIAQMIEIQRRGRSA